MPRALHFTIVLATASVLLLSGTAFSQPPTVSSNYPVVSSSDTDKLVCYMQTADGRALNLNSLCNNTASGQSQIVISHVIHKQNFLVGSVINKTGKTVYNARVNYEIIGENGSVIERGAISTEPPILSLGQTATFGTFMQDGRNVRTTSVEWDE